MDFKVQDGTWTFEHEFLKKLLMGNVYGDSVWRDRHIGVGKLQTNDNPIYPHPVLWGPHGPRKDWNRHPTLKNVVLEIQGLWGTNGRQDTINVSRSILAYDSKVR